MAAVSSLNRDAPARRPWRWVVCAAVAVPVLSLVALLVIGWYYANEILRPLVATDPVLDVRVVAVGDATVTLERTADSARPGVWGLAWPDGYARIGEILRQDDGEIDRRLIPVTGVLEAGQHARVDAHAYPAEPAEAFLFPVEAVRIPGPDGPLPADLVRPDVVAPDEERTQWRSHGPRDTWAVLVHGRGAPRSQAFRVVPTLRRLGLPALVLGYRGDPDVAAGPLGRSGLGWTEWRDVEAATDYAFAGGADEIVLVGYSMGGAIVATYLDRAEDADRVAGVVLDAPVLDWDPVLRVAADERGVPRWLISIARLVVTLRTGTRWGHLDQVARADEWAAPVLLYHGAADATVPVESSDAFAAARPDLIEYVRVEDAGHLQAWNADPQVYEAHLRAFLTGLLD